MGEYESFLMERESGVPVCVSILHNVYGTPCDYNDSRGQVIPSLIRKAIQYPTESFVVWGSGSQGRAFVHVDDVVDGLIACMDKGLGKGALQLGPDVCISIRQVAETIVKVSRKPISIQYDLDKPEGDKGRCADYSKARAVLGWSPKISLIDGLTSVYNWIEKNISETVKSAQAATVTADTR